MQGVAGGPDPDRASRSVDPTHHRCSGTDLTGVVHPLLERLGGRRPEAPLPDAAALVVLDLLALLVSGTVAVLLRFGVEGTGLRGYSYYVIAAVLAAGWLGVLALSRCYEPRFLGSGPEEFRRVFNASVRLTRRGGPGRLRRAARGRPRLRRDRPPAGRVAAAAGPLRRPRCAAPPAPAGSRAATGSSSWAPRSRCSDLAEQLRREPLAGLTVVGACVPGGARPARWATGASGARARRADGGAPRRCWRSGADTVAVDGLARPQRRGPAPAVVRARGHRRRPAGRARP